ncbi:hypothetical protein OEZ86_003812 [Tetradesmus obliquus]|nr:hypothetical protein OEZ86_003812 [Tetradesmus obliquus]
MKGDNIRKIMRSTCPDCMPDAASLRLLLSCNVDKGVGRGQLPAGLELQLPCYQKLQEFQQRQAADGCSAPDDFLRGIFMDMTPCCYMHDFCYSCAFRLGWEGSEGVLRCDDLFRNNMLAFCEALYPGNAFMRVWCDVRAQLAYNAVRAANNTLNTDAAACPAPFAALEGRTFASSSPRASQLQLLQLPGVCDPQTVAWRLKFV